MFSLDDNLLVKQAQKNNQNFDKLYEKYFDEIYRFVAWRVEKSVVQDIVSQTFLTAFEKLNTIDTSQKVFYGAYLKKIAYFKISEFFKFSNEIQLDEKIDIADESLEIIDWLEYKFIKSYFDKLSIQQAKIMQLRYVDWHSNKEISQITGLEEKTISWILSKAKNILKQILK